MGAVSLYRDRALAREALALAVPFTVTIGQMGRLGLGWVLTLLSSRLDLAHASELGYNLLIRLLHTVSWIAL